MATWRVGWVAPKSAPDLATDDGEQLLQLLQGHLAAMGASVVGLDRDEAPSGCAAIIGVDDAEAALEMATMSRSVEVVVLVDAAVSERALELIAELADVAVLTVVDPSRRDRLLGAVDGHLASPHADSDLVVGPTAPAEIGRTMADWLRGRVGTTPTMTEVVLHTPDGWELHADLHTPRELDSASSATVPAVVLMHSGRSDRTVFHRLAGLLARRGIVALALDWRGRGRSTNLGHFVDFTAEQQASVRVDVTTAYDWLAGLDRVDGNRLGVLGVAHGAGYAADGALTDERTRAIVMMTAHHVADDAQTAALMSGRVAALYVTCEPHAVTTRSMRQLFAVTTARSSRLVTYPEGLLGYQLFDVHPDLEPMIAAWFAEALS